MTDIYEWKEKGNSFFKVGDYKEAINCYTKALQSCNDADEISLRATVFSNRAAAYHETGEFQKALVDAETSLELKSDTIKTYHRKALALIALGQMERAIETYRSALELEPSNKFFEKQLTSLCEDRKKLSAVDKIEQYIEEHGTIKGCPTKLNMSMFDMSECLGEGNYSTVYRATFRPTKEVFALKIVDKENADRMAKRHPNIHNEIQMERKVLLRLRDTPRIIQLYATSQDVKSIYFIQELANGGELWSQLFYSKKRMIGLTPSLCKFYAAQILIALEFIHAHGVIHRDMKPENILLNYDPDPSSRLMYLKLADFGTAYDMQDDQFNGKLKFVGTPEYMSPETIEGKLTPTTATDVWAFGCVLYQLFTGRIPMKGKSPYLTFLRAEAAHFYIPEDMDEDLKDLIRRILIVNSASRLKISDIKTHKYFTDIQFEELDKKPIIPVPTLKERCFAVILQNMSKYNSFDITSFDLKLQTRLIALLEQRGHFEDNFCKLYPKSTNLALARRSLQEHRLYGMVTSQQGDFKSAFVVMMIDMQKFGMTACQKFFEHIDTMQPTPRVVIAFGAPEGARAATVPVALVDSGNEQGYYSFFVGGILVIVVEVLDKPWLEKELFLGKTCALHTVLVFTSPFPFAETDPIIDSILDAGTQVIIAPGQQPRVIKPRTQHQSRALITDLKPIRILRVQSSKIVSDVYDSVDEMPTWMSLDQEDGLLEMEEPQDPHDDDFSISSSESD